ncbi:MAG: hypothetical protein ACK56F_09980, partial [bacterium]
MPAACCVQRAGAGRVRPAAISAVVDAEIVDPVGVDVPGEDDRVGDPPVGPESRARHALVRGA